MTPELLSLPTEHSRCRILRRNQLPTRKPTPSAAGGLALSLLSGFLLLLAGCGGTGSDSAESKAKDAGGSGTRAPLQVVATTGMVADIVQQVAGDRANVVSLMGAGVDPHLFTPGRNDVQRLLRAEVVFYSGLHLEGRMGEELERLQGSGHTTVAVTDILDRAHLREPPGFGGHYDPHVWMDVSLWSQCVDQVATTLSARDPDSAAAFRLNADAARKQFTELDAYVKQVIGSIPESQRYLITAHDAFEYFSAAYGIEVRSIQGSPE